MPLERQVGSLLLMSYDGTEVPGYILRRLRNGEGSGVIVFGPNAPDEDTLRAATDADPACRGRRRPGGHRPGGRRHPQRGVRPPEPSQAQQATPGQATAGAARDGARALRDVGVNVNLAPVADVAAVPGLGGGRPRLPGRC